jgi:hypothetical protein
MDCAELRSFVWQDFAFEKNKESEDASAKERKTIHGKQRIRPRLTRRVFMGCGMQTIFIKT